MISKHKKVFTALLILSCTLSYSSEQDTLSNANIDINTENNKIESLKQDKLINKSLFLPELLLNTGVGSEKLIDNNNQTNKGPYLFLEGKINIYRGGRDNILKDKNNLQITIAEIEKEIRNRKLKIDSFKAILELQTLKSIEKLLEEELVRNKSELAMAKKKTDAGLTTSVDLLDFELKNENLSNERENIQLKSIELEKMLSTLYGGKIPLQQIADNFSDKNVIEVNTSVQLNESPLIKLSEKQIELSHANKNSINSEFWPTVDLTAKWGQITPQDNFFKTNEREHQVALNVNIPLFSGFSTSGKAQQAILEITQSQRQGRQNEIELIAKKDLELKKIEVAKRLISSLEKSAKLAQKYRELTIGEYKRGIKNSPDLISASDKVLELQRKIIETKKELTISIFTFNETFKNYKD